MNCRRYIVAACGFVAGLFPFGARTAAERGDRDQPTRHFRHVLIDENALWRRLNRYTPSVFAPFSNPIFLDSHTVLAHYRYADGAFYGAYVIDLRTQTIRPAVRLTDEIQRRGYLKPDDWVLSSDHRWILWRDGWLEKEYAVCATQRDGSETRRWTLQAPEDKHLDALFWLPGPRHPFVDFGSDDGTTLDWARFYSLDAPRPRRPRTVSLRSLHAGTHVLGLLSNRTALTADDWDTGHGGAVEAHRSVTLTAFRFDTPAAQVHRDTVRLRTGKGVCQLLLSPDGKQLAWLISDTKAHCVTLEVSRPNGTGRRTITPFLLAPDGDASDVRCAAWTPGCRAVLIEHGYVSEHSACFVEEIAIDHSGETL